MIQIWHLGFNDHGSKASVNQAWYDNRACTLYMCLRLEVFLSAGTLVSTLMVEGWA